MFYQSYVQLGQTQLANTIYHEIMTDFEFVKSSSGPFPEISQVDTRSKEETLFDLCMFYWYSIAYLSSKRILYFSLYSSDKNELSIHWIATVLFLRKRFLIPPICLSFNANILPNRSKFAHFIFSSLESQSQFFGVLWIDCSYV